MSGATRMSARPASGFAMPLWRAASGSTAPSSASGPTIRPPAMAPLSAIFTSSAASTVAGIFGFTFSMAHRMAATGSATPRRVRGLEGVAHDVGLLREVRRDAQRRVGDEHEPVEAGHAEHPDVRDEPAPCRARSPCPARASAAPRSGAVPSPARRPRPRPPGGPRPLPRPSWRRPRRSGERRARRPPPGRRPRSRRGPPRARARRTLPGARPRRPRAPRGPRPGRPRTGACPAYGHRP